MEVKHHEILEQKMCKELDNLEEKFQSGSEMSIQDLEKIDKLYHALKSMATYNAMKEAEEYNNGYDRGMSGARMRNPINGQYMSGHSMPMRGYSADGYYHDDGMYQDRYYPPRNW